MADSPVLVRWTGSESSFYVGGTSAPAGPRVFFCIQDDNNRLEDGTTVVDQVADMTPEGLILFRNVLASLQCPSGWIPF